MGSFGEVTNFGHGFKSQFLFDPKYTNLNHGMCPIVKLLCPLQPHALLLASLGFDILRDMHILRHSRVTIVDLTNKSCRLIWQLSTSCPQCSSRVPEIG